MASPADSTAVSRPDRTTFGVLQAGIVILTLATAAIHLAISVPIEDRIQIAFLGAAAGFVFLLLGLYAPPLARVRTGWRGMFIAWTFGVIVAYFVGEVSQYTARGLGIKAIEILLLILLLREQHQQAPFNEPLGVRHLG